MPDAGSPVNGAALDGLTRPQRIALRTLTMADNLRSLTHLADGRIAVTIGDSRERWTITRRGRKEIDRGDRI